MGYFHEKYKPENSDTLLNEINEAIFSIKWVCGVIKCQLC
jgi:hypothetical protein